MQVTVAAVMPVSELIQSNVIELSNKSSSMTAQQQAHCLEMMSNDNMSMSDMADCISECECCATACVISAVMSDYPPILVRLALLSNEQITSSLSRPITIATSLYRPPINA